MFGSYNQKRLLGLVNDRDQERVRGELTLFFGPRADVYLNVYDKMRVNSAEGRLFAMTWSWPTFFGAFVWFFYRRMYGVGALMILVPIVLGLLFPTATGGSMAAVAIFAKPAYVFSALGRILKADALALTATERSDYLQRAGGVSLVSGVLAGLLYVALLAVAVAAIFVGDRQTP